ncbi:DUF3592 domain-containing protein [Marinobacter zhejiangensis]|uniref:DUF3592 domain-containing protein n=1 Tax=Marinobacter zhejiangensis TaxID=488535 RepID=A0A1I4STF1_9GAMM|nr:DUF3592 domain-containing protein [Marinobacter zhejiangensis]SFM67620.1 Protein of unknown function [Marinobacter zhejiangensis]
MNRKISIIKYVFSVIGIAMLVGASLLYNNTTDFLTRAVSAQGQVVDLVLSRSSDSTTYYPVVVFRDASGRQVEFKSNTGSNPPSYTRGERVEVLYEAGEPEAARINGFFSLWGAATIVGGLGLVFGLVGFGMTAYGLLHQRGKAFLQKNGVRILTAFQSVERNTGFEVNGRNPYRIVSQWQHPETGDIHRFVSDNLWFDPSDYITSDTVPVLIDESNPKKYWMDTSFLPKLA